MPELDEVLRRSLEEGAREPAAPEAARRGVLAAVARRRRRRARGAGALAAAVVVLGVALGAVVGSGGVPERTAAPTTAAPTAAGPPSGAALAPAPGPAAGPSTAPAVGPSPAVAPSTTTTPAAVLPLAQPCVVTVVVRAGADELAPRCLVSGSHLALATGEALRLEAGPVAVSGSAGLRRAAGAPGTTVLVATGPGRSMLQVTAGPEAGWRGTVTVGP